MGCNTSTASAPSNTTSLVTVPNPNGRKTVVIVGASIAGFTVGEYLWDNYNVVFIDQKDHFEYISTCVKAANDEHWADKIMIGYDKVVAGY